MVCNVKHGNNSFQSNNPLSKSWTDYYQKAMEQRESTYCQILTFIQHENAISDDDHLI